MVNNFTGLTGSQSLGRSSTGSVGQKAIVVLGMHRSGTSALAGTLHHLGVDLGSRLMPAEEDVNPKGFWENEQIVEMHQSLLHGLGYTWHDARLLPHNWLIRKDVREHKNAIIEIIAKEFSNSRVWGIKDPRLCRLLPLWKEIFSELGVQVVYVHIFRNPLEVAMSLGTRNGFTNAGSLLLWFLHNIEAVQNTSGNQQVFLEYEELLRDWRSAIEKIGHQLDVRWPKRIAQVAPEIDQFLSPHLYHNKCDYDTSVQHESISGHVTTLYNLLRRASVTGATTIAEQFEDFSKQYIDAVNLLMPWQSTPEEITSELELNAGRIRELGERLRQTDEGLKNADRLAVERAVKVQHLEENLISAEQQAMQRMARIDVLDAGLREAQQLVEDRNRYVGLLEPALKEAQQIVPQQNEKIEKLENALREAQQLVEERNRYVGILEPALTKTQDLVRLQNDKIEKLENAVNEFQQNIAPLALERMQRVELLEEKLEQTKELAMQRIARIDVLDARLKEAQQLVEERNRYIDLLEPALQEAQKIVQEQNDKIEKLENALIEVRSFAKG